MTLQDIAPEFPETRPEGIPERVYAALRNYLEHKQPTGQFLNAVLCNNLHEAMAWADAESLASLQVIVSFIYWNVPSLAWGSPERVKLWLTNSSSWGADFQHLSPSATLGRVVAALRTYRNAVKKMADLRYSDGEVDGVTMYSFLRTCEEADEELIKD